MPSLLALPVIVGEWGVDHLIHNKRAGWQSNLSADEYTRQLVGLDQFNRRYPYVFGYATFSCGTENAGDWGSYDIWPEVAKQLADAAERELGGSTPAPDPLHELLLTEAARRQVIQFNPNAALQQRIFAACLVPNSPEFEVEHGGMRYVAQRGEHLGTGGVRVYYAPVTNYNDVAFVARP